MIPIYCFLLLTAQLLNSIHCFVGNSRVNRYQSRQNVLSINSKQSVNELETKLIQLLLSDNIKLKGLGSKSSTDTKALIESYVSTLEDIGRNQVPPIENKNLDGVWRLIYTSTPRTNSPIQRTVTSIDNGVSVFQVVNIVNPNTNNVCESYLDSDLPEVSNTICFGDSVRLRITAIASTNKKKLIEPRKNDGRIFGLNIFGVSSLAPPRNLNERVDFAFQEAKFEFKNNNFSIPYPVPFTLLGDEAKGWIDITYMSENFRVSRGNKGTLFLLLKVRDVKQDPIALLAVSQLGNKQRTKKGKTAQSESIIIFPAQLGVADDYSDFSKEVNQILLEKYKDKIFAAPLERLDWIIGLLPSFFSVEYLQGRLRPNPTLNFYFKKVDEAINQALEKDPNTRFRFVGHSIGGWIARAYLSEYANPDVKSRVISLTTLGSPHTSPPQIDQTRGLLSYINEKYPGAYETSVEYTSVIGNCVEGSTKSFDVESLLAYTSYVVLCGDGNAKGDGIIPVVSSFLPGAKEIVLEGSKHSNFLPTPGKSYKLPFLWYGSNEILSKWVKDAL